MKHESKCGGRPEARRVERLMCESCHVGSQKWLEGGRRLCDSTYPFREGVDAGWEGSARVSGLEVAGVRE